MHFHSSSGKVIKEDREYIPEDALALDLAPLPLTRARLWESIGLSRRDVIPRSNSANLSLKNSLDLSDPYGAIQRVQELHGSIMIIV
jgi:hypothetical protein